MTEIGLCVDCDSAEMAEAEADWENKIESKKYKVIWKKVKLSCGHSEKRPFLVKKVKSK